MKNVNDTIQLVETSDSELGNSIFQVQMELLTEDKTFFPPPGGGVPDFSYPENYNSELLMLTLRLSRGKRSTKISWGELACQPELKKSECQAATC